MKKLGIVLLTLALVLVCSCKNRQKPAEPEVLKEQEGLVTYKYKVIGLEDSVISDSIWRIIFQVEGIEKLILSQDDSMAVFTVRPELVNNELLTGEITRRGGKVIE
ncbi:MAG: hypothetical protein PVF73_03415 [Bacteroidales bacterium]|jgi:hypothetical protein